jgi:hypothetical protein
MSLSIPSPESLSSTTTSHSEEEIYDCTAQMWIALYEGDLSEEEKAKAVYEVHEMLLREHDERLYLAVWERLDAPFRSAWKQYSRLGRIDREQSNRRAYVSGRL